MFKYGLFSLALASLTAAQDACNGHAELCDRKYSDITFAASHNAAFVGTFPSHNQFEYPEQGMDMGMRYFTTQVHIEDGEIRQCHSDCALLDVGPFSEMVVSLKNWLDGHPDEVVTLLIGNGDDNIIIEEFVPIFEAAGADQMVFVPDDGLSYDNWPTLRDLIGTGKRLVVFMGSFTYTEGPDKLADHADYNGDLGRVPYIIPQFDHYVETPFSPTSDNFFNCDVDRPSVGGSADGKMIFANHNLNKSVFGILTPDQDAASETNSVGNIFQQSEICVANWGRNPNVVMVRTFHSRKCLANV